MTNSEIYEIAAEYGLGPGAVTIEVGSELREGKYWAGGTLCSHSTRSSDYWRAVWTDGIRGAFDPQRVEAHANKFHVGCVCSEASIRVAGATYVIETVKMLNASPEVTKLWVASGCDPETLRAALAGDGDPESGSIRLAYKTAKQEGRKDEWLRSQILSGSSPDRISIGGNVVELFPQYFNARFEDETRTSRGEREVLSLLNQLKRDEFVLILPDRQMKWAKALRGRDAALQFLTEYYRFYRRGDRLFYSGNELPEGGGRIFEVNEGYYSVAIVDSLIRVHRVGNELRGLARELGEPLGVTPDDWLSVSAKHLLAACGVEEEKCLGALNETGTDRVIVVHRRSLNTQVKLSVCKRGGYVTFSALEENWAYLMLIPESDGRPNVKAAEVWRL